MKTKITRHSASACLEMLPDGVLLVGLCGPITGVALLHFKGEIVRLHGPRILAVVMDYTRAAVLLDGADLDRVLDGEGAGSAVRMPAALVSGAEAADMFLGYALKMAGHGVLRYPFLVQQQALQWAHRHAERLKN